MDRATKLARVTRLRDRALDLLKTKGAWHTGGHGERLLGLDLGDLSMLYRTPFQVLPRQEQHLHDMRALIGGKANLPYGLDIAHDRKKVMFLEWDVGKFQLITYFGASDGEPRQEIDPWRQVRDYRDANTYAETVKETDADRIGIWGSSYSGGHVLVVGAIDRRVKCVVAQVPLASGHSNARRLIRADYLAGVQKLFEDDRRTRMAGGPPGMIPVVAEDPAAPSALPTPDSWTWFTATGKSRAPSWKNEVTLRSVEMFTEYEPGSYAGFISPTPLLMVVALGDVLTVADLALAAYETALEPKRLVTLSGGHFDAYVKDFDSASKPAVEWFSQHLASK